MTVLGIGTDLILVIIAIGVAVGGWRRGALVTVASLAGLLLGFWIGGRLLRPVLTWLSAHNEALAGHPVLVSAAVLLGSALIVQSLAFAAAYAVRRRLGASVRGADSVVGAAVGVFSVGLVVWLAAGFVRTTPLVAANAAVADSRVVAAIDRVAPIPSSRALGSLQRVLQRSGFPRVFSGQLERIESIDAPDRRIPAAVRQASGSVVRVLGASARCGYGSEGSGWVTSADRVVTNAHVVAGADRIAVQVRGVGPARPARLVAFDPERDVAVLRVDGLTAPALRTAPDLERGDPAVAAGYPGNGPFTYSPARVRQTVSARGLDIYNAHIVHRDIYALRASIRAGDSGGPLLDRQGRVAGMVFARSTADPDTGYALTLGEVRPALRASADGDRVGSGACRNS